MSANNPEVEIEDQFYTESESPELETKTTDKADVTEQDDQLPGQDDEIIDNPDEVKAKSEELDESGSEEETQYIDLDGTETSLDDIRTWKNGHIMQSDYTKKTTEHAQFSEKERGELALERENLSIAKAEVSELRDKLTVLAGEDEAIDWAELKDEDPEEYIRLKEKADQRKDALSKVKADRETPQDDPALIESERALFWKANPDWLDKDNKTTDAFVKDTALMNAYAANAGFSSEEFSKMTSSKNLITILKAAKYDALQEKGRKIREKRLKVPVVTKPKVKTNEQHVAMEDVFYSK